MNFKFIDDVVIIYSTVRSVEVSANQRDMKIFIFNRFFFPALN